METLKELTELGEALGCEGTELQSFVCERQDSACEERKNRREAEKVKMENE